MEHGTGVLSRLSLTARLSNERRPLARLSDGHRQRFANVIYYYRVFGYAQRYYRTRYYSLENCADSGVKL